MSRCSRSAASLLKRIWSSPSSGGLPHTAEGDLARRVVSRCVPGFFRVDRNFHSGNPTITWIAVREGGIGILPP